MKKDVIVIKLYVNQILMVEKRIEKSLIKKKIESWKKCYGLHKKDYQIFLCVFSRL